jgi:membrane protein DedA with SNARE-associated domain
MTELSLLLASHAGPVLFVVIFAEMIGLPFPAAPVLVAAGALVAGGGLSPALAIAITVAACVLGDLIWFFMGRRHGNNLFQFIRKILRRDSVGIRRTERVFARHGMLAIAAAKFIPGVGFLIPALAGSFRIPFAKFLCFDLLGSLLYGIVYMELGFFFSNEIIGALQSVSRLASDAGALALLPVVIFAGYKYAQHRRAVKTPPASLPCALRTIAQRCPEGATSC